MALFSIIVPVYKVEEYLQRCVNSILNQSFKDFELILINDGSPDKCPQMCDDIAKKDSRVKVIHKENGGVSSARNMGLDAATGEYVWFVDSDDAILADSLEFLADKIGKTHMDMYVFNTGFNELITVNNLDELYNKYYFKYVFGFGPCNKIYSMKSLENIRFDTQETIGEDLLFNVNVYCNISSIAVYNEKFYSYISREDSAMHTCSKERHINQMRLYGKIKEILKGKVSEETLAILFFMHLVSGLNQSVDGGLTQWQYRELFKKYQSESGFDEKLLKTALDKFLDNENASLFGRLKMKLLFYI